MKKIVDNPKTMAIINLIMYTISFIIFAIYTYKFLDNNSFNNTFLNHSVFIGLFILVSLFNGVIGGIFYFSILLFKKTKNMIIIKKIFFIQLIIQTLAMLIRIVFISNHILLSLSEFLLYIIVFYYCYKLFFKEHSNILTKGNVLSIILLFLYLVVIANFIVNNKVSLLLNLYYLAIHLPILSMFRFMVVYGNDIVRRRKNNG